MGLLSTPVILKGWPCYLHHLKPYWSTTIFQKLEISFAELRVCVVCNNHRRYLTTQRQHTECNRRLQQLPSTRSPNGKPRMCSNPLQTALLSGKMFLHQAPLGAIQSRRYLSTEPTTAYEVLLASKPVQLSQALLEYSHDLMGLPWCASLVLSTFLLRAILTFPLGVYSQYIRAKVELLQPEIVMMAKQAYVRRFAERAKLEGWSEKRAEKTVMGLVKLYSKELFIRENCHPAKGSILFLVQFPLWVCLSMALRNMTGAFGGTVYLDPASLVPALSTEGALWFPDLTVADPFYVLPVLVGVLNLCNIEMMALHSNPVSRTQRYVTNFLRGLSLAMIPIAAYVPTAMTLYWASSAFYGLGQNLLLKSPRLRSALNVPSTPSDSQTPYQDMADIFQTKYLRRKGANAKEETGGDTKEDAVNEAGRDGKGVRKMRSRRQENT